MNTMGADLTQAKAEVQKEECDTARQLAEEALISIVLSGRFEIFPSSN